MQIKFKKSERGGIELFLLGAIVIGAFFLVGGAGVFKKTPANDSVATTEVICCDSGNGDACVPDSVKKITFAGSEYGLLRSETKFLEGNVHLKDSGRTNDVVIDGQTRPVILNNSDTHKNFQNFPGACDNSDTDKYVNGTPGPGVRIGYPGSESLCTQIANDEIIYVCKENCNAVTCDADIISAYGDPNLSCYGNETTKYDAYFKLSDYPNPGVPPFIKNCSQRTGPIQQSSEDRPPQSIHVTPNVKHDNLQLNTFGVSEPGGVAIPWFSPFCKPAVYLYPESETQISVKVNPLGPFTYTTPLYTPEGWNVTAYPDGKIISNGHEFPYLYYEADIPSLMIGKPDTGYMIKGTEVRSFIESMGPKLGLNTKETTEMAAYWQDALPTSPYYFVGIIPESTLDSIAPLTISPRPTRTIRVALYFKESDTLENVTPPILTPKTRTGFSVVEWGGILKTAKPFTCLQ